MYKNVSYGCCGNTPAGNGYAGYTGAGAGRVNGRYEHSGIDGINGMLNSAIPTSEHPKSHSSYSSHSSQFSHSKNQEHCGNIYSGNNLAYGAGSSAYSHSSHSPLFGQNYQKPDYDHSHNSSKQGAAPVLTLTKHTDVQSFFDTQFKELTFADEEYFLNTVRDCFEKTAGRRFPANVKLHIFDSKAANGLNIDGSVLGFAMNRIGKAEKEFVLPQDNHFEESAYGKYGQQSAGRAAEEQSSEIFIRLSSMAEMLVVAGHELGHILTPQLWNMQSEEAKAYSFMLEWLNTIKLYNIAGLGAEMRIPDPAKNNVHDKALGFVLQMERNGWKPMNIFRGLCEGLMKVSNSNI